MLLLAHSDRETIILETSDGPIEIRLSHLDGDQPRIGIDAPKSVRIIRREVAPGEPTLPNSADPGLEDDNWWYHPEELAAESSSAIDDPPAVSDSDDSQFWQ